MKIRLTMLLICIGAFFLPKSPVLYADDGGAKLDPGKVLNAAIEVAEATDAVKEVVAPEKATDNKDGPIAEKGKWYSEENLGLIGLVIIGLASLCANLFDSKKATSGWLRAVLKVVNIIALNFSSKAGK